MKMSVTYTNFEMYKIEKIINQVCTMSGTKPLSHDEIEKIMYGSNVTSEAISVCTVKNDDLSTTMTIQINEELVGDFVDVYSDAITGVGAVMMMLKSLFNGLQSKMEAITLKWADKIKPKDTADRSVEDAVNDVLNETLSTDDELN